MVCLGVISGLVLREVGRNRQYVGAGFGGDEGNREVRLVLRWDVDGFNSRVGVLVNREYGASGAELCLFVVVRGVVYQFVIFQCVSPDLFDVLVFCFR